MLLFCEHLLLGRAVRRAEYGCRTIANSMSLSSARERAQALQSQGGIYMVRCDCSLFHSLSLGFPSWMYVLCFVMLCYGQTSFWRELVNLCKMKPQAQLTKQFMVWMTTANLAPSRHGENVWIASHKSSTFQVLSCPAPNLATSSFHSPYKTVTRASCNTARSLFWAL